MRSRPPQRAPTCETVTRVLGLRVIPRGGRELGACTAGPTHPTPGSLGVPARLPNAHLPVQPAHRTVRAVTRKHGSGCICQQPHAGPGWALGLPPQHSQLMPSWAWSA
jgi:hypothetical protein